MSSKHRMYLRVIRSGAPFIMPIPDSLDWAWRVKRLPAYQKTKLLKYGRSKKTVSEEETMRGGRKIVIGESPAGFAVIRLRLQPLRVFRRGAKRACFLPHPRILIRDDIHTREEYPHPSSRGRSAWFHYGQRS
jgi:hypothetical protein